MANGSCPSESSALTDHRTGVDRMAFARANITRDNTRFVNGAIVDQGLGIGSKFPLFNRHQLTLTKFIPLKDVEEGAGKPPSPRLARSLWRLRR
uniref:Uncharacterized protein n=1 Tax=Kalanchoe fedtschenkoi TaxID=63787 RepID=A0A7N0U3N1_KALFE